ncbi:MAG: ABC transporter permease [Gammaproteobacteria bacterium]
MNHYIGFKTIVTKEMTRFLRIWTQTLLPPAITTVLYFIIFGQIIGSQIRSIHGFSYIQYIAPGLIMMAVITNSYGNVVSSFYSTRFQRSIEEMLVSPMPNALILLGFVAGGVARGIIVGSTVTVLALFFTELRVTHIFSTIAIVILTSALFSLAGFLNGIFARSFDDVAIVPTFILTPLTYLGGVFYAISSLPPLWQTISLANPILYMVDTFRYGILGIAETNIALSFGLISLLVITLFWINLHLLNKGVGIRT